MSDSFQREIVRNVRSTFTPGVLCDIGLFGGLFDIKKMGFRNPVLVASVDGVGTKLKVAVMMNKHNTVGRDLVAHCVNDIAVQGAVPLFFMDYIGATKVEPKIYRDIIKGFVFECKKSGCALLGGETAQMPGMYPEGEYDLVGTIVGAVERGKIIDGSKVRVGDTLIGLASNGLHTNGYSLARKVFFDVCGLNVHDWVDDLRATAGAALLKVHTNYAAIIQSLIKEFTIKALAHITGGGLPGNLCRVLPEGTAVEIEDGSWPEPKIFKFIAERGGIERPEMFRTFNMGIGLVAAVSSRRADDVLRFLRAKKVKSYNIGRIVKGKKEIHIC